MFLYVEVYLTTNCDEGVSYCTRCNPSFFQLVCLIFVTLFLSVRWSWKKTVKLAILSRPKSFNNHLISCIDFRGFVSIIKVWMKQIYFFSLSRIIKKYEWTVQWHKIYFLNVNLILRCCNKFDVRDYHIHQRTLNIYCKKT